ncbi:MAG: hypothetical protein IID33_13365 [Planctomycetes bacterium]|nr:hypothetical protein [Planctomycetota bacterium]
MAITRTSTDPRRARMVRAAVDAAIEMENDINNLLRQSVGETSTVAGAREALLQLHERVAGLQQPPQSAATDTQEEPAGAGTSTT